MPQFPRSMRGPVEKPLGLGLGRQQGLNLGAKTGIAAAGLIKEHLALHAIRHIQRGAEDLFFSLVCRIHERNPRRILCAGLISSAPFLQCGICPLDPPKKLFKNTFRDLHLVGWDWKDLV